MQCKKLNICSLLDVFLLTLLSVLLRNLLLHHNLSHPLTALLPSFFSPLHFSHAPLRFMMINWSVILIGSQSVTWRDVTVEYSVLLLLHQSLKSVFVLLSQLSKCNVAVCGRENGMEPSSCPCNQLTVNRSDLFAHLNCHKSIMELNSRISSTSHWNFTQFDGECG